MTTYAEENNRIVHPSLDDLIVETDGLFRHRLWDEAAQNMKRLLRLNLVDSNYSPARCQHGLGDCAMNRGNVDRSIWHYREALRLDPTLQGAQDNLIFLLDAQPGTTDAAAQRARDDWWTRFGEAAYAQRLPHTNVRDPEKRLRIGYVSGDFRFHSAGIAYNSVILNHSDQIEPIYYSTLSPQFYDNTTRSMIEHVGPAFVDVSAYSPATLAEVVRDDQVDILVDLSGYTAGNRLLTFAYKPAPVQISAWGYATGVGWPAMDVLFSDPVVATPAMRQRLHERVYDLPCVIGYYPHPQAPEANALPCLESGPIFSVFQRASKLNREVLRTWTKILERVPESQILFKGMDYNDDIRAWIVREMSSVRHAIQFQQGTALLDHLCWYQAADLSLDPWPQTGGVSTMETCWMGVPCVTLLGDRVIQRTSASILTTLGLSDFVAMTREEYIDRAVALVTTERARLAEIRGSLRERLRTSPIMDGYVDRVEDAYRQLWRDYCVKETETHGT